MSKRVHFWLMVLNASFVGINAYFMTVLENATPNALAAFVCLAGFCIAFSNYINPNNNI